MLLSAPAQMTHDHGRTSLLAAMAMASGPVIALRHLHFTPACAYP
jgi:hypothetical protein